MFANNHSKFEDNFMHQVDNYQGLAPKIEYSMSLDELDKLKQQNEERIRSIEEKYFQKREETRQVKEIF